VKSGGWHLPGNNHAAALACRRADHPSSSRRFWPIWGA
jgi:hypothetical protein